MSESEVKAEGQGVKEEDDLTRHVSPGDILAAARAVYGRRATVTSMRAEKATASISGFTSLMLRVHVTIALPENAEVKTTFIVKRLPTNEAHQAMIIATGMFDHEIAYFTQAVPILRKKISKLPLVEVYAAHNNTVIMEDLSAKGYKCLPKNMREVGSDLLKVSHIKMVLRKLAAVHVASLGEDWLKILPRLEKDAMFENCSAGMEFRKMVETGCKNFVLCLKELYPQKYKTYGDFILDPKFYECITKFVKADSKVLNVLCHGDCWVNNMMFKIDSETEEPVDVKFIDLQMCRYGSPSRDLIYFLYSCTKSPFRKIHEEEFLRCYVEAFNTYACVTPDLLSYEEFTKQFDNARLFGVCMALVMRPLLFMENVLPGEKEELTGQHFEMIISGDDTATTIKNFTHNIEYRENMIEIIDEAMEVIDKWL